MGRLTKTYSDGTHAAADDLPCGENSYDYKDMLIEKLGKYEDAEEGGLLVKLPCKVGDTVFIIVGRNYSRQRVNEIKMFDNRIECTTSKRTFSAYDFGKNVFTTREAAEMELKNRWEK